MPSKSALISDLEALLVAVKSSPVNDLEELDETARMDLLSQVESIHYQLDDPILAMYRPLVNFTSTSALRLVLEIGALPLIPREGSITAKELAATLKYPEELLARMLLQLVAVGTLKSVGENTYAHTRFSLAYIGRSEVQFFKLVTEEFFPVAYKLPEYIAAHASDNSKIFDAKYAPFPWANDREGKVFYEILQEDPARLQRFAKGMMTTEAQKRIKNIFSFQPLVAKALASKKENEEERPFIVDIGGSHGQSLLAIRSQLGAAVTPSLGPWIIQDKPAVISSITPSSIPGIIAQPFDFFNPQPVIGAHVYHLRRILHNWSDAEGLVVLTHTAKAMKPDSTLIIGEMVIPRKAGANKYIYYLDLVMFLIGGKERTGSEFEALLGKAGLRLVKIWGMEGSDQTIIEAVLM